MNPNRLLALITATLLLSATVAIAQSSVYDDSNQPVNLGDIARKNRAAAPHKATTVLTEEDIAKRRGPIPDIVADDTHNESVIEESYRQYAAAHKPEEAEQELHTWYDAQVSTIYKLRDQNNSLRHLRYERQNTPQEINPERYDRQHYQADQKFSVASDYEDGKIVSDNINVISKMLQTLRDLKAELDPANRYLWFKADVVNFY